MHIVMLLISVVMDVKYMNTGAESTSHNKQVRNNILHDILLLFALRSRLCIITINVIKDAITNGTRNVASSKTSSKNSMAVLCMPVLCMPVACITPPNATATISEKDEEYIAVLIIVAARRFSVCHAELLKYGQWLNILTLRNK